jgi:hypothetical protein
MKIRDGFVSNSSSSSFIVAVPSRAKKLEIKVTVTGDLNDFIDERIKTVQELDRYLIDEYGWDLNTLDKNDKKIYEKCIKNLDKGKDILVGCFSTDSDNILETVLCNEGIIEDTKDIKVIEFSGI